MKREDKSFTLIELLVVIAIIAILAGMLLPALGAVKETGKQANCTNNLKQMGTAFVTYENNYNEMPYAGATTLKNSQTKEMANDFNILRMEGLDEPKSFMCPSCTQTGFEAANTGKAITQANISYGYFTNTDRGISTSTCGPSSVIVADAQPNSVWNHDKKGAYLRIDSSVSRPGGASWCKEISDNNALGGKDIVEGYLVLSVAGE